MDFVSIPSSFLLLHLQFGLFTAGLGTILQAACVRVSMLLQKEAHDLTILEKSPSRREILTVNFFLQMHTMVKYFFAYYSNRQRWKFLSREKQLRGWLSWRCLAAPVGCFTNPQNLVWQYLALLWCLPSKDLNALCTQELNSLTTAPRSR